MVIGMYLPVVAQLHAQHGLITTGQLARAGLGPYEIDRLVSTGRLLRLRRGVYVDPDAWADLDPFRQQPRLRMRAASMSLTSTAYAFSHDSSAIVLAMGAPDPRTAQMDGLRVLDRARTALDMVREHGRAHGLAACDAAMRHGVTRGQLTDMLGRMTSWPHSRCMRWCVEHADPLAETYLESLVRDFVLELGIGRPELQFGLKYADANPSGELPRTVLMAEKQRHDFLTASSSAAPGSPTPTSSPSDPQPSAGWRGSTPTRVRGSARTSTT
jgi:hypothetical protein